ncbi:MAG: choice-of-anchor U domain-containing protein [Mariprofundales bacterium]
MNTQSLTTLLTCLLTLFLFAMPNIYAAEMSEVAIPNIAVAFAIDESGSMSDDSLTFARTLVHQAINELPHDGSVDISLLAFATNTREVLANYVLNKQNLPRIHALLDGKRGHRGWTNTDELIIHSSELLANAGNDETKKLICLITDGVPTKQAKSEQAALMANSAGIDIAVVGLSIETVEDIINLQALSDVTVANLSPDSTEEKAVSNICGGMILRDIMLELSADFGDFGMHTPKQMASMKVDEQRTIILRNNSSHRATISKVDIKGANADDFHLLSIAGKEIILQDLKDFFIAPHTSMQVVIALRPRSKANTIVYSDGDILSARLVIFDNKGRISRVPLTAQVSSIALRLDVLDAQSIAQDIYARQLTEEKIKPIDQKLYARRGYVADGNSRLLLRAQSNQEQAIQFTISNGQLQSLDGSQQGETITIASTKVADGLYQATTIVLAHDIFPEKENVQNVSIQVQASINANILQKQTLNIRRAPVLLVHGLWGSDSSWREVSWLGQVSGLKPWLEEKYYNVGTVEYPNWQGPSQTMLPDSRLISNAINSLCQSENQEQIACTRANVVAHSMGGLVVREFIRSNKYYKQINNFQQGSIYRFITLGTPYKGSGFASFLLAANDDINQCITDFDEISSWHTFLEGQEQRMGSAINDLQPHSRFLDKLLSTPLTIPTYAIVGDMKQTFMYGDAGSFMIGIPGIGDAGCSHENLFHNAHADQIVSVISAQGDVDAAHTITIPQTPHVGMGKNKRIFKLLTKLLQQPYTASSAKVAQAALTTSDIAATKTTIVKITSSNISDNIVLFSERKKYMPNESITMRVKIQQDEQELSEQQIRDVAIYDANGEMTKLFYQKPYEWTFTIPAQATGTRQFYAIATINDKRIKSAALVISIQADMSQLRQLLFEPEEPLYMSSGEHKNLHVMGLFSDGYKRSLHTEVGNKFSELLVNGMHTESGDSPVISISQQGIVTAIQPGLAEVMVSNGTHNTVRRIVVTAVNIDDDDGDSLSNDYEKSIGTNPYNVDSDNDGIQDDLEVGSNLNAPHNIDGIGVIDALNAQVLSLVDEHNTQTTLKTSAGIIRGLQSLAITDFTTPPDNIKQLNMEHGILDFRIEELQDFQKVDVTIIFDDIPKRISKFIKYGPKLPDNHVKSWYEFENFTIKDNSIILHLQDNNLGDSDPILGSIHDPIGMVLGQTK